MLLSPYLLDRGDFRKLTKEINTHLGKPMTVQEEMCVIFIANTTQAKWADAVKVMTESVFVERTKLHTKFRQTPDTYYIANTVHSSFQWSYG